MIQCSTTLIVGNEHGIHGRIAARLAAIATDYGVQLMMSNGEEDADCSMILDVLALGVVHGSTLHVRAYGQHGHAALLAAEQLLTAQDDPL